MNDMEKLLQQCQKAYDRVSERLKKLDDVIARLANITVQTKKLTEDITAVGQKVNKANSICENLDMQLNTSSLPEFKKAVYEEIGNIIGKHNQLADAVDCIKKEINI